MKDTIKVYYKGRVITCDIINISPLRDPVSGYAAYCKTTRSEYMWVYSYTEDMNSIFKAEIEGKADSLDTAYNYSNYNYCNNLYTLWGGGLRIKYNWQKSPVRERY